MGSLANEASRLVQALHDINTVAIIIVIGTINMLIVAISVISTGIIMQLLVRNSGVRNMLL